MSNRTAYWILLTSEHITDTYILPEGDVRSYAIAPIDGLKKDDTVYLWWNPGNCFYGWGTITGTPIDFHEESQETKRKRKSVSVKREKEFHPRITTQMMLKDSRLKNMIPTGFNDLCAISIRPGLAHGLNDYIREHGLESPAGSTSVKVTFEDVEPKVIIKALLTFKDTTTEGKLIEAVTVPWFDIIEILIKDPKAAFGFSDRQWEEIVAGAYKQSGFDDVILTRRSGDYGRDVIAIKKGLGTVRIIDQVKAFKPDHLVTANDVRALAGVLQTDGASKGFLTTTSDFAPRLRTDPLIMPLIPQRLELIDGQMLLKRLIELRRK